MNIDLRNIDFEEELKQVMNYLDEKTASKAIRHCVRTYLKLVEKSQLDYREKVRLESQLRDEKEKIKNVSNAMRILNSLIPEREDYK